MNQQTSKPDQPKVVLVYSALTIGFAFLLTLIWLIGSRGVEELKNVSIKANESADDYKKRLTTAREIREETVNILAQAKVLRYARGRRVPIPPFGFAYKEARESFKKKLEAGRKLWSQQADRPDQALMPEEMKIWKEVESNAPEFLASIEELALAKESEKEIERKAVQEEDNANPVTEQNKFFEARQKFDPAVVLLSDAVVKDQVLIFNRISDDQKMAAERVSQTRWNAIIVGLFVAVTVFLMTRSRFAELRRAVRSAQNSKDFARSVFDSQSNGILVVAENGDLSAVNQAFFKHLNLKPSGIMLQDYQGALAHLPEVVAFIRKTLKHPEHAASAPERIEIKPQRGIRQSQSFPAETRLFDAYASPLTIEGETRGRVIVLVDVTEAEQVREELRRNRTLSAVGQITAQVAHELYNPIGAVKLNIELLEMQMSGADDDLKHTVARLKRGAEHLSTIVMDLRYLTRPRDPERKRTNLNTLLDEVVELASDRLERARTLVVRHYAANLPPGNFDSQQLRKVFLNLLINAIEASPVNAEVELHTVFINAEEAAAISEIEAEQGALAVRVVDHGSGMSEETLHRIFEAFYTTKRNGTGLGMMITQEIIRKHGGKIEIESEEGKGTKVSVYLPA
ncbi:MAG: ATP-binding protein [Acidobacteriota bacterium]